jgi:hypothetical protein
MFWIGLFIGLGVAWTFPQPKWVTDLLQKIKDQVS